VTTPTAPRLIRWTSEVDPYGGRSYHGEPLALLDAAIEAGQALKQAAEAYQAALRRLPPLVCDQPAVHAEADPADMPGTDDLQALLDAGDVDRLREAFAKALVQDAKGAVDLVERLTGAVEARLKDHVSYHLNRKIKETP
jgi:hypothetical protein